MKIWSAEIKELESLYSSIKGRFPELEKEVERLIKADDENMALLYSRRCLEVIIADLCECELKRPRGTEPLKGIIDKLSHEKKVPSNIIASMEGLNALSTFGTHPKDFDPEQVKPVLNNLKTILKWYFKFKSEKSEDEEIYKLQDTSYKVQDSGKRGQGVESQEGRLAGTGEGIKKSKKKLIITLSGIIVTLAIIIAVLFIFNIIGGGKKTEVLEKSIAVLPFVNDSQDEENTYFINGIMEEILLNLQTIKDLRVPGRTSVEQYRNPVKSIPEIAKELGVSYIVEGSGQKYGNTFTLRVQLLEGAKDRHLWGESYEEIINGPEDIFRIQNRIAESIAEELKAIITPEEKQLIEKVSTTSLTAYDFFQKGRDEHTKYWVDNNNSNALKNAEIYYHEALHYDSAFAHAYTGLARVYWDKHYWEDILSKDFLDSVLILCDIALSYDDQLSEAYTIRGQYFNAIEKREQAIKEFDKAIKFNPNDWMIYAFKGETYGSSGDVVKCIENLTKAASIYRGPLLPSILDRIAGIYREIGCMEEAKNYITEAFKLDRDSIQYYWALANIEYCSENYEDAIEFLEKVYALDTNNTNIHRAFGEFYMMTGNYVKTLEHLKKWLEKTESLSEDLLFGMHRVGWAYWQNGNKEQGEYYFNEQINYCNRMKELGRVPGGNERIYYDLAGVYAFRGEKDKAFENLRKLIESQQSPSSWLLQLIKNDPLLDNIRDEPEFQQIVRDYEAKYQAEHERVRKWLEERNNGMME
jgi:TolB-like protein/Tfp pilus assembly protein PilF